MEQSDATLLTFSTDWRKGPGFFVYELSYHINVRQHGSGSQVRLTGKVRTKNTTLTAQSMLGGEYNIDDIEKRSSGGKYWQELEKVALKMGGEYRFL